MYSAIICEDEQYSIELLMMLIQWNEIGIRVAAKVTNGPDALEAVRKYKPDIVLTDVRMPGLSGIDLIRMMREESIPSKVIIISGYDDFAYAQQAVLYGASEYILKPFDPEKLTRSLRKIVEEQDTRRRESDYVNKLRQQLVKMEASITAPKEPTEQDSAHEAVAQAKRYIEANYNQNITLGQVAEAVFMNAAYLSQLFKKEVGTGFSEYLTSLRVEKAKTLLMQPFLKVNDVAGIVGYQNVGYFNRVFKTMTGLTPTEYREHRP